MVTANWRFRFFAAGFSGIIGQIVILRGFESLFGGNELTLGVFFAGWLLLTGLGAFGGRYLHPRWFRIVLILQALTLFAGIIIFRFWLLLWGRNFGVNPPLIETIIGGFVLTLPFAFTTGFLFSLGIKASGLSARTVYLFEAAGAGIGGLIAALLLGKFTVFQFAFSVLLFNGIAAMRGKTVRVVFAVLGLAGLIWLTPLMEKIGDQVYRRDFELVIRSESKYGEIIILQIGEQYGVFQNGSLIVNCPDSYTAEESVHFPLLAHPQPEVVFLIGNGFSGGIDEILKYRSVEKVVYAEIDAGMVALIREYLPSKYTAFLQDPRVELVEIDGRAWLKSASQKFDCIINALPDPATAQNNRYFTAEFFKEAQAALKPEGIFGFSVSSSEDFIDDAQAEFLAGMKATLASVFDNVRIIPGAKNHFLASSRPFAISVDSLLANLQNREIQTDYISPYYLPYRMNQEHTDYLTSCISSVEEKWINTDFHPLGYIKVLDRWERQFHPRKKSFFQLIENVNLPIILLVILLLSLFFCLITIKKPLFERGVFVGIGFAGMGQIGIQLLLLLGFQSLFGYLYYQQAILIAAFMVGASGGSYISHRWSKQHIKQKALGLICLQGAAVLLPFITIILLWLVVELGGVSKVLLTLWAFFCGTVGGMHFGLAVSILSGAEHYAGGSLYAVDLFGSALGAFAVGLILIPVFGFYLTALVIASASLIPLVILIAGKNRYAGGILL